MRRWLVLCLACILAAGCGSKPEIWNGYGGSGSRSLCSADQGPKRPRLVWVADLEGDSPGSMVVDAEGNIYVPHSGGSVSKVDKNGSIQWRFDSWVSGADSLPPHLLLLPDRVLLSTQGAREETFSLSSKGEIIVGPDWLSWPSSMSPASNSSGYTVACHQWIHSGGTVALRVFGLVKGGGALWKQEFAAEEKSYFGSNPVVLDDGRSYVFVETDAGSNSLVALGSAGELIWQTEFPRNETRGVGMAIAASHDGTVYFGTPRIEDVWKVHSPGMLYAVGADGSILWQVKAGQRVEQILISPGLVVANVLRTKLLALNSAGEELWEYPLAGWESNGVMDSRGVTYMAGVRDNSVWLRAVDSRGKALWQYDTGQRADAVSYLALANGTIFLVTDNGKLMAVSN